jgi:hypothetical protein
MGPRPFCGTRTSVGFIHQLVRRSQTFLLTRVPSTRGLVWSAAARRRFCDVSAAYKV